mgnify:CR=1 FL=1
MRAQPLAWYSKDWKVSCEDGREVVLDLLRWREGAELDFGGESFSLEKAGVLSRDFVLRRGDTVIARAYKPSSMRSRFEVEIEGEHYELEKASAFGRSFIVRRGGRQVGSIQTLGAFSRKCQIDLPHEWPLALRLFLFWLAVVVWNRETATVAATSGT